MQKMGFNTKWITTIMRYITLKSYSISINDNTGREFQPSRGLRWGDPPNPFLFLICNEGLSALMRLALRDDLLRGAKASRGGPFISHLLFANNCILFGKTTIEEA